ncbi:MAG: hypothetical protein MUC69_11810 [Gemmatimonadales bacterium]|jgi:hypothetical protein|nr:hypothetical protein [Gemmatimonadales bacterium]
MRRGALLAAAGGLLCAAPVAAQHIELEPDHDSVAVGDVVTYRMSVHLGPQETLASYVPALAGELPDGVRLVAADTLRRDEKRILRGTVQVAYYRIGTLQVPQLQVVVRHTPTDRGTPYTHDARSVTVTPTLPPGNPPLKDIRDPVPPGGPSPLALLGAALVGVGAWLERRRRRRPAPPPAPVHAAVTPPDPRGEAMAALAAIAAEWPARDPVRAVELGAGVLRRYLGRHARAAHDALTTSELMARLAPSLDGSAEPVRRSLAGADAVKFARVRPDAEAATSYLAEVRRLLELVPPVEGA